MLIIDVNWLPFILWFSSVIVVFWYIRIYGTNKKTSFLTIWICPSVRASLLATFPLKFHTRSSITFTFYHKTNLWFYHSWLCKKRNATAAQNKRKRFYIIRLWETYCHTREMTGFVVSRLYQSATAIQFKTNISYNHQQKQAQDIVSMIHCKGPRSIGVILAMSYHGM